MKFAPVFSKIQYFFFYLFPRKTNFRTRVNYFKWWTNVWSDLIRLLLVLVSVVETGLENGTSTILWLSSGITNFNSPVFQPCHARRDYLPYVATVAIMRSNLAIARCRCSSFTCRLVMAVAKFATLNVVWSALPRCRCHARWIFQRCLLPSFRRILKRSVLNAWFEIVAVIAAADAKIK